MTGSISTPAVLSERGGLVAGIEVEIPEGLERYELQLPGNDEQVKEALDKSLQLLQVAPPEQSWPLVAAAYLAPLNEILPCDFLIWVYGPTGQRKSTACALAMSFYGNFDRNSLPGNFTSTGNALELQSFAAKDALFVMDDFSPPNDAQQSHQQEVA